MAQAHHRSFKCHFMCDQSFLPLLFEVLQDVFALLEACRGWPTTTLQHCQCLPITMSVSTNCTRGSVYSMDLNNSFSVMVILLFRVTFITTTPKTFEQLRHQKGLPIGLAWVGGCNQLSRGSSDRALPLGATSQRALVILYHLSPSSPLRMKIKLRQAPPLYSTIIR